MLQSAADDLWDLTARGAEIDADKLAKAVEAAAAEENDFRTRLLIRDSIHALENHWGKLEVQKWLGTSSMKDGIERICKSVADVPEEDGFPSLRSRIVKATRKEDLIVFLRELSALTREPTDLFIG